MTLILFVTLSAITCSFLGILEKERAAKIGSGNVTTEPPPDRDWETNKINVKILGINYLDEGLLDGRFIKRIKGSKSILSKNVYTT